MPSKLILSVVSLSALLGFGLLPSSAQQDDRYWIQRPPAEWSQSDCFNFLEYSAWTGLGGGLDATMGQMGTGVVSRVPLTDAYAAISAAASAAKPAFMEYLKGKMLDANDNNNLELLGRYQAMYDAMATGNNDAWLEIQREQQRLIDAAKPIPDDDREHEDNSDYQRDYTPNLEYLPNAYSYSELLREELPEFDLTNEISKLRAERKRLEQSRSKMAARRKEFNQQRSQSTQSTATRQTGDWRDKLKDAGNILNQIDEPRPTPSYRYGGSRYSRSRYNPPGLNRNR